MIGKHRFHGRGKSHEYHGNQHLYIGHHRQGTHADLTVAAEGQVVHKQHRDALRQVRHHVRRSVEADPADFLHVGFCQFQVIGALARNGIEPDCIEDRAAVADHRRDGGAADAHVELCHKNIVQHTVENPADHDDDGRYHGLALSDDEDAKLRLQQDGQRERTQHRVVRPQIFDVSVRRTAKPHDGISKDQADSRKDDPADDREGHDPRKRLAGFLSPSFADFFDDDGVAAAADHDSHRDEKTDDRIIEADGADRHRPDIAFNKQPVHHLVYADEDEGKDAGCDKLQQ